MQNQEDLKKRLAALYRAFNNRQFIKYDPIKYVYEFKDDRERELVGLISSCLSFGRVRQIFGAMDALIHITNHEPLNYVLNLKKKPGRELLSFRYRFVNGLDVYELLASAKKIIEEYGSIGGFAKEHYKEGRFMKLVDDTIIAFHGVNYLIPCSLKGSPCKRLFMFFRWMVRDDNIDLGLWKFINPQELVIPLDTHIFRVSRELGLTGKKTASLRTAMEITERLKAFSQEDPVKYDWGLSRVGIIRNNFGAIL